MAIDNVDNVRKVELQIHQLHRDLLSVESEGLVGQLLIGWWLGPVKFVANPMFAVAEAVVPAITNVVPFSDRVVGWSLGGVSNVAHLAHSVGAKVGLVEDNEDADAIDAADEFRRFLNGGKNDFYTILGFGTGVVMDLMNAVTNREKVAGWFKTFGDLFSYLNQSGIGKEMKDVMFQLDFLPNLILLAKAQAVTRKIGTKVAPTYDQLNEGYHFMKYSTAAYGIASIKAALAQTANIADAPELTNGSSNCDTNGNGFISNVALKPGNSTRPDYITNTPHEFATLKSISKHIGIPKEDIVMFAKPGGSNDILRHFVAIDHRRQQVILAIRGTFSVSGIVIDVDGDTCDFCGGQAHNGIARQAERLWTVVGGIVMQALNEHPDFELIITGHSLGAGTACLLTIKCYHEHLVGNHKVRCFAYASPAVFTPLSAAPEAVANTVGYIHDDDCVSFMSVANLRELMDSVEKVKKHNHGFKIFGWKVFGNTLIDDHIVRIVERSGKHSRPDIEGAPKSYVPASSIIWMRGQTDGGYKASVYHPEKLPEIFVDVDMITDHFPPFYEEALLTLTTKN